MKDFLVTYSAWFYYGWLFFFSVHVILNHIIYFSIDKEEFEDYESRARANIVPILLAIFTFHWSKDYQDNEDYKTKILMKASNILSPCLITYTFVTFFIWLITYEK